MANNTPKLINICIAIAIIIAIILLLPSNVFALTETTVTQYSYPYVSGGNNPGERWGQTIDLTNVHRDEIMAVEVIMRKYGSPGSGTFKIYSTSGGLPNTVLYSEGFTSGDVSSSCGSVFFGGVTLTDHDSNLYAFSIEGGNATDGYEVCDSNVNPYSGGQLMHYAGGTWNTASYTSYDMGMMFQYRWNNNGYSAPTRTYPTNGATGVSINPTFTWNAVTDPDGDNPMHYYLTGDSTHCYSDYTGTSCTAESPLAYNTTYDWIMSTEDHWCYINGGCGYAQTSSWTFTTELEPVIDTTSITNLTAIEVSTDYIRWNWTNPSTPNYDHVIVYKNGAWVANVTNASHDVNFTYLDPNTNYTISTQSVSTDGVINSTWVNATTSTMVECGVNEVCHLLYQGVNPYHWFIGNTFKIPAGSVPTATINSIQMVIYKIDNYNMSYVTPCVTIYDIDTGDSIGGGCGESHLNIPDINESGKWIFAMMDDVVVQTDKYYAFLLTAGDVENAMYVVGVGNHTFPPYGAMAWSDNGTSILYDNNSNANYIMAYTYNPLYDELYVAKNGNDGNLGTSWGESWLNLYIAVNNINNSGTIHIGYGDYSSQSPINGSISTGYMFWCDSTGYKENVSEPWCDMPGVS